MAVAAFAYAQPPGRGARAAATGTGTTQTRPDAAVKTYLNLTDSQLTGFEAIRTTARTASDPIRTQLRTKDGSAPDSHECDSGRRRYDH